MATAELEAILESEHREVHVQRGTRSGLAIAVAIHRLVDRRSLGGCRVRPYLTTDHAVRDVERLARSMTFKAAAAGLRVGGGKGVIALPPDGPVDPDRRRAALHDFAELVDSLGGRYVTAQDVGTTADDIVFMAQFTSHVTGRPGLAGDPSPYTAYGVEVAIRASLRGASLAGRHVIVIGVGNVGGELARRLARAGARLTVSDVDESRRALADELGADWVEPSAALDVEADVLAPCALGGILDPETVKSLRVPVVSGAANNQLAGDAVADALRARGILWAPDFIVNAGGLIAVVDELHGFDRERVERRVLAIGDTLAQVYERAESAGTNTLEAAYELAGERLAA
jgi:leucine dehydrogenase